MSGFQQLPCSFVCRRLLSLASQTSEGIHGQAGQLQDTAAHSARMSAPSLGDQGPGGHQQLQPPRHARAPLGRNLLRAGAARGAQRPAGGQPAPARGALVCQARRAGRVLQQLPAQLARRRLWVHPHNRLQVLMERAQGQRGRTESLRPGGCWFSFRSRALISKYLACTGSPWSAGAGAAAGLCTLPGAVLGTLHPLGTHAILPGASRAFRASIWSCRPAMSCWKPRHSVWAMPSSAARDWQCRTFSRTSACRRTHQAAASTA